MGGEGGGNHNLRRGWDGGVKTNGMKDFPPRGTNISSEDLRQLEDCSIRLVSKPQRETREDPGRGE